MQTSEHFVRLFDYEIRCTDLTLRSLRDSRQSVEQLSLASLAAPFERAVAIFCHIQAARRLWLHRIEPALAAFPPDGVFPIWDLKHAEAEAHEMDELWRRLISTLPSRDLNAEIAYTSTEGVEYRSTLSDMLIHVVNHSSYHRGQIANLVAATGTKPAVTDYIALTRRTV
jgi:uncharacterized damage-inducible protein DinB